MITVELAQAKLLSLASQLPTKNVLLDDAIGHFLAEPVIAKRSQPVADLSAMDGYAIRFGDLSGPFTLIGHSAAGAPFCGPMGAAEAVRIFTGAHVPAGSDCILVQEDTRAEAGLIHQVGDGPKSIGSHIRRKGSDFGEADVLVGSGELLSPGAMAAAAMAGYGRLAVGGSPRIKILATGDELVAPGAQCGPAQIPSSNNVMLRSMLNGLPCTAVDAGIVSDDLTMLTAALADVAEFDVIVTSGGASVGDHDLVQDALIAAGADIEFWKVAMRPGKPMMAGRIGSTIVLGLPGNPASAFVTAHLFLLPLVRWLAGANSPLPEMMNGVAGSAMKTGDGRCEYMRGRIESGIITPFTKQDSGMVRPLIDANALICRPANCPPLAAGEMVSYLAI